MGPKNGKEYSGEEEGRCKAILPHHPTKVLLVLVFSIVFGLLLSKFCHLSPSLLLLAIFLFSSSWSPFLLFSSVQVGCSIFVNVVKFFLSPSFKISSSSFSSFFPQCRTFRCFLSTSQSSTEGERRKKRKEQEKKKGEDRHCTEGSPFPPFLTGRQAFRQLPGLFSTRLSFLDLLGSPPAYFSSTSPTTSWQPRISFYCFQVLISRSSFTAHHGGNREHVESPAAGLPFQARLHVQPERGHPAGL